MKRRSFIASLAALAGAPYTPARAADGYPSRPIRLLIPFSPGGSTDVFGRKFAVSMNKQMGQTWVVENRAGAAGGIAGTELLRASPDGYTLMLGTSSNTTAGPATNPHFQYDPRKDFAPIGIVGVQPIVLLMHPSVPANSLKELVALIKANPEKYSYGSGGIGGISHLTGELFKSQAGNLEIQHIAYKGSAPAIQDLLAGRVQFMFDSAVPNLPFYRSGQERILATFSEKRLSALPDVPTTTESGYPALQSATILALLAPAATPAPILDALIRASRTVMANPAFAEDMGHMGIERPDRVDPQDASHYIAKDMAKWSQVAKSISLKLE